MAGVAEADVEARRHAQISQEMGALYRSVALGPRPSPLTCLEIPFSADMRERIRADMGGNLSNFYAGYAMPGYPYHGANSRASKCRGDFEASS